jgi:hypothetical protein
MVEVDMDGVYALQNPEHGKRPGAVWFRDDAEANEGMPGAPLVREGVPEGWVWDGERRALRPRTEDDVTVEEVRAEVAARMAQRDVREVEALMQGPPGHGVHETLLLLVAAVDALRAALGVTPAPGDPLTAIAQKVEEISERHEVLRAIPASDPAAKEKMRGVLLQLPGE